MFNFDFFKLSDIIATMIWLSIIIILGLMQYIRNRDKEYYKYFLPHFFYKLFFGLAFATIYITYYQGGDTVWYWDGAVKLNNLFWYSPKTYLVEIFSNNNVATYLSNYNSETGYPPIWIYRESEGFLICKITSFLTFFTFNSYYAMTLIYSYMIMLASWKLFEIFREQNITSEFNCALAALFIPSSNFWCSGIMKDTIVLSAIFYLLYAIYSVINNKKKLNIQLIVMFLLSILLIYKIRSYMLISLLPPLLLSIGNRIIASQKKYYYRVIIIRLLIVTIGGSILLSYLNSGELLGEYSSNTIIKTAVITQKDFATNTHYGENRYDIGLKDASLTTMISVIPAAILAGFYRPYIWEANSLFMLITGLESLILIVLTLRFLFYKSILKKFRKLKGNEFLLFSFVFILILAYFVGFTAGIFGALVRFKAPLLPFLVLLTLIKIDKPISQNTKLTSYNS